MKFLPFLLAVNLLACSGLQPATSEADTGAAAETSIESDTAAPPADTAVTDSGTDDTGRPDTSKPDAAGACNALDNVADTVTTTRVAEALPTFAGGAVSEGTYVVTAVTEYTGTGGSTGPKTGTTMKQTLRLAAGKFEIVRSQNGAAEKRSSGTYGTTGSTFTLGGACPTPGDVPVQYEASGSTLKISLGTTIKEVITYTKK
jgi:hypothetical protein